jgi:hypothetical protein
MSQAKTLLPSSFLRQRFAGRPEFNWAAATMSGLDMGVYRSAVFRQPPEFQ